MPTPGLRNRLFLLLSAIGGVPLLITWSLGLAPATVLLLLLLVVPVAGALATVVARPAEALFDAADRIREGDLKARPYPWPAAHWGQLAEVMTSLAGRLDAATHDIDRQVVARTEALTRKADQLRAVSQVGGRIAAVLEPEQLLQFVVRVMHGTFGYDVVAALQRHESHLVLAACAARNVEDVPLGKAFPLPQAGAMDGPTLVTCAAEGTSVQGPASALVPDLVGSAELAVPMLLGERVVGVLAIQSRHPVTFDSEDQFILETIAGQVAVALENARLLAAERQLRDLSVAEERNRMAREIHDTLAQGFMGIIMHLRAMQGATDGSAAQHHRDEAEALARESLQEARRSVQSLRPLQLEGRTLGEALAAEVEGLQRRTGLLGEFITVGEVRRISPDIEGALLRIAQEALHNTLKHANADHFAVRLDASASEVVLTVRDDGTGFDRAALPAAGAGDRGYGLRGMAERAEMLGGRLTVESSPGNGCVVTAVVPTGRS